MIRLPLSCLLVFAIVVLTGCQQSMTGRLTGEWVGRPDTAAAAQERSAKLKARHQEADASVDAPTEDAASNLGATDLEQHDVTIRMTLDGDKTARLSLGDGSKALTGIWRLVTTLPPDGAEVEISLEADGKDAIQKRRFIIDFQQNGDSSSFTLVEKGADPQFGRLYFVRDDS